MLSIVNKLTLQKKLKKEIDKQVKTEKHNTKN